jgi:hypothetical protein
MKTATGLALVAIGAILAFAVNAHPRVLNVQAAGWVLILIGLAGMFVPRRGYGWLRRRMVVRPRRTVVARPGLPVAPGSVVVAEEPGDDVAVGVGGIDPEVFPGRQLSKAEAEELTAVRPTTTSETIEEFRPE